MAARYKIFGQFSLVYIQYTGVATATQATDVFIQYMKDPERKSGHRHFVDLSAVTGLERDFAALFRLQALKAEWLMQNESPTMMVYLAPSVLSLRIAHQVLRSWEGLDGAIIRLAEDWDGAMDIFGLPRNALDHLLIRTA
ncbi:hypothetical protein [Roseicyclus mahoneyensis]|uniref:STAS domain-containing protein n=1 Tax=Roseicyclus mahoneyensis TaxID=164332 RepID=A0A316GNG4_9RHOB|nr:hypothetical protein [Roseicyclus mahoneyensis]PWK62424.1 hypothetical protein C7455_101450 [Roseicyclus mahoneyensis]